MQFPNLISRLQRRRLKPPSPRLSSRAKLLVVVEGRHDVVFLRALSRILHAADPAISDMPTRHWAKHGLRFLLEPTSAESFTVDCNEQS